MFEVEDLADLIEDHISNDFNIFLAIDENGNMLVQGFLLLL